MIRFRGSPNTVHLWREFYAQTKPFSIDKLGKDGALNDSFLVLPKITDGASIPAVFRWFVSKSWIIKSALWHDGCDRTTRRIAIKNDYRFAVFAAAEMRQQRIRFASLRAAVCFVAVRLGWNTGFDGSPPVEVFHALNDAINAGDVPVELKRLLPES